MEELGTIKNSLRTILDHFKKRINQPYTEKTLNTKRATVNESRQRAVDIISKSIKEKLDDIQISAQKEVYREIKEIVNQILEIIDNSVPVTEDKMVFDIKTANTLVPIFDGSQGALAQFVNAVELLKEITPNTETEMLFKFLKTRLTGKALELFSDTITNTADLLTKLKQECKTKTTSDAVMAQMKAMKQGNSSIIDYTEKLERMVHKLKEALQAEDLGPGSIKLANKIAIQALNDGISNPETSLILRAGTFKDFNEAATKAISVDKPIAKSVFHFKINYEYKNNYGQNSNRENRPKNNFFQNNYNRNYNNGYNKQHTNNYGRNQNFNRNFNNYNNNTYPRQNVTNNGRNNINRSNNGNNGNRYRNYENNQRQNRVHYIESGEVQPPQPTEDPTRLGGIQVTRDEQNCSQGQDDVFQ